MRRRINLIIDLQFGSTGKGLLAGFMATYTEPDTVMTAWAPNAGHTYIDENDRKFVHTMLANGVVSPKLERVMIGPGSLINMDSLARELEECRGFLRNATVFVHKNAAIVTEEHIAEEAGPMTAIGSTKKGVGAAMIQRIRRQPKALNTAGELVHKHRLNSLVCVVDTKDWLSILDLAQMVQIEGAQGYSLSMYHGMYPYTTSRDVTTHQILADCGLPHDFGELRVTGTCRTFPIRVANRFNEAGEMVGWSGPHYPDQREISWNDLNVPVELTTVTKLPRRVFTFSMMEIHDSLMMNGVDDVFLNFANYCRGSGEVDALINAIEAMPTRPRVRYVGWGPTVLDVRLR